MFGSRRVLQLAFVVTLLGGSLGPVGLSNALADPLPDTCGKQDATGMLPDGATYRFDVPPNWNGTLFLYSHGYNAGPDNPPQAFGDPLTCSWLLGHGYALAGSSYASTGWAIEDALKDQVDTLKVFDQQVGHPTRTIAWGHSLGGIITAGLIQRNPTLFSGALPMCGVLAGGVATWNTALDSAFAFKTLLGAPVTLTGITDQGGNLAAADAAATAAQQTPQGRARLALAAALGDTPGWFDPLSPEPAATDFAAQEANQFLWDTKIDFLFVFALRAELERRAHGNFSWNTGVDYVKQLARSADAAEVRALYDAAGLDLNSDLQRLNSAPRISADPAAVRYVEDNIVFNGQISIPVLAMHTTGDGLVIPENEQAYRQVVATAGDTSMLRQIYVHRAGHCSFSPAETITAAQDLLRRLDTGQWDFRATDPAVLNASAAALGPTFNILPPSFQRFQPPLYPRPFDAGDQVPTAP